MLRLRKQVDGDSGGISFVVSNNKNLSRPGGKINPNVSKQLAFCLGDKRVSRAGYEVGLGHRLGSKSHCCDGLNSTKNPYFISASVMHSCYC